MVFWNGTLVPLGWKIIPAAASLNTSQFEQFSFLISIHNAHGLCLHKILGGSAVLCWKIHPRWRLLEYLSIPTRFSLRFRILIFAALACILSWVAALSCVGKIILASASLIISQFVASEKSWLAVNLCVTYFLKCLFSSPPWSVEWNDFILYCVAQFPKKISFACLVSMWGVTPWASRKIIPPWYLG